MEWWQLPVGFLLGLLSKIIYDSLKTPSLDIGQVTGLFAISAPGGSNTYLAYRVKVVNKQKGFLDAASEKCVAWLDLNSAAESYQLNWVGGPDRLTINVGDFREIDLCAINQQTGEIIAPTERGYFSPEPRIIGNDIGGLSGRLRVTSSNSKGSARNLAIRAIDSGGLEIRLEQPSS